MFCICMIEHACLVIELLQVRPGVKHFCFPPSLFETAKKKTKIVKSFICTFTLWLSLVLHMDILFSVVAVVVVVVCILILFRRTP